MKSCGCWGIRTSSWKSVLLDDMLMNRSRDVEEVSQQVRLILFCYTGVCYSIYISSKTQQKNEQ